MEDIFLCGFLGLFVPPKNWFLDRHEVKIMCNAEFNMLLVKKFRIRETRNLSTNADSSTDTIKILIFLQGANYFFRAGQNIFLGGSSGPIQLKVHGEKIAKKV